MDAIKDNHRKWYKKALLSPDVTNCTILPIM